MSDGGNDSSMALKGDTVRLKSPSYANTPLVHLVTDSETHTYSGHTACDIPVFCDVEAPSEADVKVPGPVTCFKCILHVED